jgi:hypothetical protein
LTFGIVAPGATQGTTLQEDSSPDARTILGAETLDVEGDACCVAHADSIAQGTRTSKGMVSAMGWDQPDLAILREHRDDNAIPACRKLAFGVQYL